MIFNKESDFEEALIKILCKYGWENKFKTSQLKTS